MWLNLWCNNSKQFSFHMVIYLSLTFPWFPPKNACFLCAPCVNVTQFFSFSLNYIVQNTLWDKQVCPEFMNVMIENNLPHKSGTKSTLCNVTIKGSPLLSHIFLYLYFLFHRDMISLRNLTVFIHIFQRTWNKTWNLWCHVVHCSRI